MIHKTIQKKLILYLDSNLSERETNIVKEHLSQCRSCQKEIKTLSAIWRNEGITERITPSEYLWTRLEARLNEPNTVDRHPLYDKLIPAARLSVIAALVLVAIFVGNYIGKVSDNDLKTDTREYLWNTYSLEAFEPIPTESIGKAFTLALNSKNKEVQQ